MARKKATAAEASARAAPLTSADRELIDRLHTAEAKIHQQELIVAEAQKKLRGERGELCARLTELRALTRELPLFDG